MKRGLIVIFALLLMVGCDKQKKLPPLTNMEITKLHELRNELNLLTQKEQLFNAESQRIKALQNKYISTSVDISNISVKKFHSFKDGLARACLTGSIKNNGNEHLSELRLGIDLFDYIENKKIYQWKPYIYKTQGSNESYVANLKQRIILPLNNIEQFPILAKGEHQINEILCMKDSIPNWYEKDLKISILSGKLSSKVSQFTTEDSLRRLRLSIDYSDLAARAENNNQQVSAININDN